MLAEFIDPAILGFILIGVMLFSIFVGFPISFTLIFLGFVFGYLGFGKLVFYLMTLQFSMVMTEQTLAAVPLFVFMGIMMEQAGLMERLFSAFQLMLAKVRGSLYYAVLFVSVVFAAATGIVGASVTILGIMAAKSMNKSGYNVRLAAGTITAGGTLGILIPPSIMLIVYAAIAELSPLRLYAAAIIPGFMLAGFYMIYVIGYAFFRPSIAPKPLEEEVPPTKVIIVQLLTSFVPLALLIMSVLGSILLGLATPAEAAAIGATGGLFLAFCYKSLTWTGLKQSVFLTAKTTAMVCWLFVGSWTFASIFSYLGGHSIIEHWILGLNLEPWQFLVLVQIIIFLLGWPLEWTEILIIFVPIFLPMLDTFGVNPYFFAMLVALNLQTSFLTPPMAMAAYYLKGVVGDQIELIEIFKNIFPYLAIVIFTMVLMYNFPGMALFLPDYFFGVGK